MTIENGIERLKKISQELKVNTQDIYFVRGLLNRYKAVLRYLIYQVNVNALSDWYVDINQIETDLSKNSQHIVGVGNFQDDLETCIAHLSNCHQQKHLLAY